MHSHPRSAFPIALSRLGVRARAFFRRTTMLFISVGRTIGAIAGRNGRSVPPPFARAVCGALSRRLDRNSSINGAALVPCSGRM